MDPPRFVGLCGVIGSGKDVVARHLCEAHGYEKLTLAEAVKEAVLWVYGPLGVEPRHLWGTQADKAEPIPGVCDAAGHPCTGRQLVTAMGEAVREQDPRAWIKRAWAMQVTLTAQHYSIGGGYVGRFGLCDEELPQPGGRWVLSDVRFPNEVDALRQAGGVLWEVVRVGGPPAPATPDAIGHVSEHAWVDTPKDAQLIALHGDLEGLRAQADTAVAAGGREHAGLRDGL